MLTLPVPAGVSTDSTGRDHLLFFLLLHHRSAVCTSCLPQEHPRHQATPQGPTAHRRKVLQQHGRGQEGGRSERHDGSSVGLRLHRLQLHLVQFDQFECFDMICARLIRMSWLRFNLNRGLTACFPAGSAGGADEHPEATHQSHGERPAELPPIRAHLLLPGRAGLPSRTLSGRSRARPSSSNSRLLRVRNSFVCCVQGDLETTAAIEGCVMDCLLAMVMKLSEVTFRPLFFKVTCQLTRCVGAGRGAGC